MSKIRPQCPISPECLVFAPLSIQNVSIIFTIFTHSGSPLGEWSGKMEYKSSGAGVRVLPPSPPLGVDSPNKYLSGLEKCPRYERGFSSLAAELVRRRTIAPELFRTSSQALTPNARRFETKQRKRYLFRTYSGLQIP